MSNFCINCGRVLEDMTCDRCPCMLEEFEPPAAADAGGRYRLRRWDAELEEWIDGISQPWDVKDLAIKTANDMAEGDGERYMVVDRLFNPVYDTHYLVGGFAPAKSATAQPAPDNDTAKALEAAASKRETGEG